MTCTDVDTHTCLPHKNTRYARALSLSLSLSLSLTHTHSHTSGIQRGQQVVTQRLCRRCQIRGGGRPTSRSAPTVRARMRERRCLSACLSDRQTDIYMSLALPFLRPSGITSCMIDMPYTQAHAGRQHGKCAPASAVRKGVDGGLFWTLPIRWRAKGIPHLLRLQDVSACVSRKMVISTKPPHAHVSTCVHACINRRANKSVPRIFRRR